MVRKDIESLMRQCLVVEGFDFSRPQLHLAWLAFRKFLTLNTPGFVTLEPYTVECIHYGDRDDVLWVSLSRLLRVDMPTPPYMLHVGCCMKTTVPPHLRELRYSDTHWEEHETVDEWFCRVENAHKFWQCIEIEHWEWEGFSC